MPATRTLQTFALIVPLVFSIVTAATVSACFFVAGYTFNLSLHVNTALVMTFVLVPIQCLLLLSFGAWMMLGAKERPNTGFPRAIRYGLWGIVGSLLLFLLFFLGLDLVPGRWFAYARMDSHAIVQDIQALVEHLGVAEDASLHLSLANFPSCKAPWQHLPSTNHANDSIELPATLCALHPQEIIFESGFVIIHLYGGGPVPHEGIVLLRPSIANRIVGGIPHGIVPFEQHNYLYRYTLYDYRMVFDMVSAEVL
jgi:hypothetical protein